MSKTPYFTAHLVSKALKNKDKTPKRINEDHDEIKRRMIQHYTNWYSCDAGDIKCVREWKQKKLAEAIIEIEKVVEKSRAEAIAKIAKKNLAKKQTTSSRWWFSFW